jgi:hypothetical protein
MVRHAHTMPATVAGLNRSSPGCTTSRAGSKSAISGIRCRPGCWVVDLPFTWMAQLSDDSIPSLLRFYGPMFLSWALVSFRSVRRSGRLSSGAITGLVVAAGTSCVFYIGNLLRVNVFLAELTGRADWKDMMQRFRASGFESLRVLVHADYLKVAPFKIGVASVIGAVLGLVSGPSAVGRRRVLRRECDPVLTTGCKRSWGCALSADQWTLGSVPWSLRPLGARLLTFKLVQLGYLGHSLDNSSVAGKWRSPVRWIRD